MFKIDQAFMKRLGFYMIGVFFGIIISVYYVNYKMDEVKLKRGDKIPEIGAKDQYGKVWTKEDLKGDFILINFWASYIAPCRGINVDLKYLYKQYHGLKYEGNNDFKIVSISVDHDEEEWKKAMEKDSITWVSLIVDSADRDSIMKRFGIKDIPTAPIMLDSSGEILAKTRH